MSEYVNNSEKRLEALMAFTLGMMNGEDGKTLIVINGKNLLMALSCFI